MKRTKKKAIKSLLSINTRQIERRTRDKITNNNSNNNNIDNRRYQAPPHQIRNKREEKREEEKKPDHLESKSLQVNEVECIFDWLNYVRTQIQSRMRCDHLFFCFYIFLLFVQHFEKKKKKKDCNKEMNTLGFVQLVYIPSVCVYHFDLSSQNYIKIKPAK